MKSALLMGLSCWLLAPQIFAADKSTNQIDDTAKLISKTFDVAPGGELTVEAEEGDIEVVGGNQSKVHVEIERKPVGVPEDREAKALKNHRVKLSQDGNNVHVEAGRAKPRGLTFHAPPEMNVHIRVTVPRRFDVTINTGNGSIEVSGVRGMVDANSAGGDLTFAKIEGALEGRTSGGNVSAEGCTDKVMAQTSGGGILLKNCTGESVTADTLGGEIDVSGCEGKLQAKSAGGNISISDFTGPGVYADTSGGRILFDMTKQPEVECRLRTGGGNIIARVPESVNLNLGARTDGGSLTTAIPVSGMLPSQANTGHIEGKINAGGPIFTLHTTGGNIELLKR